MPLVGILQLFESSSAEPHDVILRFRGRDTRENRDNVLSNEKCNGAASRVLRRSTDGRWRRNRALADGAIGASASVVVLELLVRFVRRGIRWKGVGIDLRGWTLSLFQPSSWIPDSYIFCEEMKVD